MKRLSVLFLVLALCGVASAQTTMLNASVRPPTELNAREYGPRLIQVPQHAAGVDWDERCSIAGWGSQQDYLYGYVIDRMKEVGPQGNVWGWFMDTEWDLKEHLRFRLKANPTQAEWNDTEQRCYSPSRQCLVEVLQRLYPAASMPPIGQYGYPSMEQCYPTPYVWQGMQTSVSFGCIPLYGQDSTAMTRYLGKLQEVWPTEKKDMVILLWIRRPGTGRLLWAHSEWTKIIQAVVDAGWVEYLAVWSNDENANTLRPYLVIAKSICDGTPLPPELGGPPPVVDDPTPTPPEELWTDQVPVLRNPKGAAQKLQSLIPPS